LKAGRLIFPELSTVINFAIPYSGVEVNREYTDANLGDNSVANFIEKFYNSDIQTIETNLRALPLVS
jgi:hypothetical protein